MLPEKITSDTFYLKIGDFFQVELLRGSNLDGTDKVTTALEASQAVTPFSNARRTGDELFQQ